MLQNIELEQALALIREKVQPVMETQYRPLHKAAARILAEDIVAGHDQPPFDRSPLDGYALRSADLEGAGADHPAKLEIIDEIYAGMWSDKTVKDGQAIRIMTGAPIPRGADCVIKQELTRTDEKTVLVCGSQKRHDNICFRGEDYKNGQLLIPKGEKLDAVKLGVIAGNGQERVKVFRTPKVAVVTTGDEICPCGRPLTAGKIYDSNCQMLSGRVTELQCGLHSARVFADDVNAVCRYLEEIIGDVDCVITVGALSVGKKDIMHDVIDGVGADKIFRRVRLKPGSPVALAMLRGKPVLSLSGNPFAALATFEVVARPMLARLKQDEGICMKESAGVMKSPFRKKSAVRRFLRAVCEKGLVSLRRENASGILSSVMGCNCILEIPAGNQGLEAGDQVKIWLL